MEGRAVKITFEAATEQDAIARVLEFERHPELLTAGAWEAEVEAFILDSRARKLLSEDYGRSRRTVLLKAGKDMGLDSPEGLTEGMVRVWLAGLRERLPEKTANHYLAHLKQFAKWLVKSGRMYSDPCKGVEGALVDFVPRDVFLEAGEVRKLLDAARRLGDAELELILLLACEAGLRHGEISAARAEWVDLSRGMITVPAVERDASWARKGRAGRKKKVSVEMVGELREWFARNGVPEPYLLQPSRRKGKSVYRYEFRKKLRNFLTKQGFPAVTVHDLRRSFGSNRVSAGVSIEQVANWMGIDPRTVWKHYARFIPASGKIEVGSARAAGGKGEAKSEEKDARVRMAEIKGLLEEGLISAVDFELKKAEIIAGI